MLLRQLLDAIHQGRTGAIGVLDLDLLLDLNPQPHSIKKGSSGLQPHSITSFFIRSDLNQNLGSQHRISAHLMPGILIQSLDNILPVIKV